MRNTQLVAFILALLISLQSVAAANMSVCNSLMQAPMSEQSTAGMPCHQQMIGMYKAMHNKHGCIDKTTCKSICASFSAMTAIPSDIRHSTFSTVTSSMRMLHQSYTSVTLPNPQRPPILLS